MSTVTGPGLVRTGTVLALLGASVAVLWAVAFGATAGCTEIHCPGVQVAYSLAGVDVATATVRVSDGCNTCVVARPVVAGAATALVGCLVGGVGLLRR